jgi:CRISPR system Cascade subunit CasA
VAGLRTERDDTKPVSLLLPAVAAGNNVPLFSARTEADPPSLTPAEAVRALLSGHCWDTAAFKSGVVGDPTAKAGKTAGNPTGPLGQLGVVVPIGPTLRDTLLLNTPVVSDGLAPDDLPQWRREPATAAWQERPASGLLDLLTWQSRRIRLVPETTGDGTVVVRRVVVAAGDRLTQIPVDVEPHTAWRVNPRPAAGQASVRPVRHVSGRSAWRGMAGLLATSVPTDDKVTAPLLLQQISNLRAADHLPPDYPLQVLTVGVQYGNQSAVVEDVIVDQIPLPVVALVADDSVRAVLLEVTRQAEELREAANRLGDDIRAACGADKIPRDRSQRLGDTLVQELTPVVRRLLRGLAASR